MKQKKGSFSSQIYRVLYTMQVLSYHIYTDENVIIYHKTIFFFGASVENHQCDEFCPQWKRGWKTVSDFY